MRSMCLALLFVAMTYRIPRAEGPSEASFLVKVGYTAVNLPTDVKSTCLVVFPDGRFHMERWSEWPGDKPRILEDSISSESLTSLRTVLEGPELKQLKTTDSQEEVSQGEIAWGVISRGETSQKFGASAWDAAGGRPQKPFPVGLRPLLRWTETTVGEIDRRGLSSRKSKAVECWLKPEKRNPKKKN